MNGVRSSLPLLTSIVLLLAGGAHAAGEQPGGQPARQPARQLDVQDLGGGRYRLGAIEIDIHLPWGSYFLLKWGEVAELPVPVPRNDDYFSVRLRTDGFPDWEGELSRLTLRAAGTGEGVVRR